MPVAWSYVIDAAPPSATSSLAPGKTLDDVIPKDIAIDPLTGDMAIFTRADGGKEIRLVSGVDAIVQRLRIRFGMWLGEWFLDTRQGVPWIERVYVASPNLSIIESMFREIATTTPGIARVKDFKQSFDRARRTLSVERFQAVLADASTLRFTNTPFVLS